MKDTTGEVIEELKLLLEIWKALEEPRLTDSPGDPQAIALGQQKVARWIEHHLRSLPMPPPAQ
jgi:hypothetical protein